MAANAAPYRELIRPLVEGRRFVLCGGPLVGATSTVRALLELGAERPVFVVCDVVGVGPVPEPDEARWFCVDVRTAFTIETIRAFERALVDPPRELVRALDEFDPERRALVLGSPFALEPTLAGRHRYGHRPASWAALEDKTRVGAVLEEAGLALAPWRVVDTDHTEPDRASRGLDGGDGVVWAGDTSAGHSGFAEYVRWVRGPTDAERAYPELAEDCRRVRVMPFLEGVPCSIHGMVFPDAVAAFRPVEMITLREPETGRFRFAGSATYWDPPVAERRAMRDAARRLGEVLRRRIGYRGAFTLDGVLTGDGFRPTELNTRFGGGLRVLAGAAPEVPLGLIDYAVRAGEDLDYRPDVLEGLLVEAADRNRRGASWLSTPDPWGEPLRQPIHHRGDGYELTDHREEADAVLEVGSFPRGTHVRVTPDPERTEPGPPLAPAVVDAFALADRELGTRIGPLEACRSVGKHPG